MPPRVVLVVEELSGSEVDVVPVGRVVVVVGESASGGGGSST
jgi:hypothetical protein